MTPDPLTTLAPVYIGDLSPGDEFILPDLGRRGVVKSVSLIEGIVIADLGDGDTMIEFGVPVVVAAPPS